jgi:hypothetical protein
MEPFKEVDDVTLTELVANQQQTIQTLLEGLDEATEDEIKTRIREFALNHLENALSTVAALVNEAEKETTQLSAAKTVINLASGAVEKDGRSPIEDLFNSISKK